MGGDGKLIYNTRGHLLCNYCGIPSHPRSACRHRIRDAENGLKRTSHPARGTMASNNQFRREAQAKSVAAADHWNPRAPTPPHQNQNHQITQWQGQNGASAPMIITVTNPEDQQWLSQVTSSGCDPASVITSGRKRQQQQTQAQSQATMSPTHTAIQNGHRVSSLLPSGMVACNECGETYATLAQTSDHYYNVRSTRRIFSSDHIKIVTLTRKSKLGVPVYGHYSSDQKFGRVWRRFLHIRCMLPCLKVTGLRLCVRSV